MFVCKTYQSETAKCKVHLLWTYTMSQFYNFSGAILVISFDQTSKLYYFTFNLSWCLILWITLSIKSSFLIQTTNPKSIANSVQCKAGFNLKFRLRKSFFFFIIIVIVKIIGRSDAPGHPSKYPLSSTDFWIIMTKVV